MRAGVCACVCVRAFVCMYVLVCMRVRVRACVSAYVRLCVFVRVCVGVFYIDVMKTIQYSTIQYNPMQNKKYIYTQTTVGVMSVFIE